MVEGTYTFCKKTSKNGGVMGAIMGVINMEESLNFYKNMLDYSVVLYDKIEKAVLRTAFIN